MSSEPLGSIAKKFYADAKPIHRGGAGVDAAGAEAAAVQAWEWGARGALTSRINATKLRSSLMDLLRDLRAFVRAVETGSFAAVARETHESHSAVTRQIEPGVERIPAIALQALGCVTVQRREEEALLVAERFVETSARKTRALDQVWQSCPKIAAIPKDIHRVEDRIVGVELAWTARAGVMGLVQVNSAHADRLAYPAPGTKGRKVSSETIFLHVRFIEKSPHPVDGERGDPGNPYQAEPQIQHAISQRVYTMRTHRLL